MDALSRFCCLNSDCPDYGSRGAGNLSVREFFGKRNDIRLLYCKTCKKRFSERKGTPFFRANLSVEKIESILEHVQEGCGLRKTARLTKVSKKTVARYIRTAGEHARDLHDELVAFSPSDSRGSA